jgi:hypothetical protein
MRWSYETPEPSLVVSDGKTLWIYDPGFGEAQRLPADGATFSGAALQFLLGRGDLQREFSIRLASCESNAVELELTPREPASYEKLFILVDPATGDVSRTRVDDLVGNSSLVEFSDLQVNLDPPAGPSASSPQRGSGMSCRAERHWCVHSQTRNPSPQSSDRDAVSTTHFAARRVTVRRRERQKNCNSRATSHREAAGGDPNSCRTSAEVPSPRARPQRTCRKLHQVGSTACGVELP